jgi:hypothetical protein
MTKRIELPGHQANGNPHWALLYDPEELPEGNRVVLLKAGPEAYRLQEKLKEIAWRRQQEPKHDGPEPDPTGQWLIGLSGDDVEAGQLLGWASICAFVKRWSLTEDEEDDEGNVTGSHPRPLPTMENIKTLPGATVDALLKYTYGNSTGAVDIGNPDQAGDPDSPSVPSAGLSDGSKAQRPSSTNRSQAGSKRNGVSTVTVRSGRG